MFAVVGIEKRNQTLRFMVDYSDLNHRYVKLRLKLPQIGKHKLTYVTISKRGSFVDFEDTPQPLGRGLFVLSAKLLFKFNSEPSCNFWIWKWEKINFNRNFFIFIIILLGSGRKTYLRGGGHSKLNVEK